MIEELSEFSNEMVVIDTKSAYIYIGTLTDARELYVTLEDVDVHDHSESNASKDLYIIETLKYGIKANRRKVKIIRQEIISISLLSDIIEY